MSMTEQRKGVFCRSCFLARSCWKARARWRGSSCSWPEKCWRRSWLTSTSMWRGTRIEIGRGRSLFWWLWSTTWLRDQQILLVLGTTRTLKPFIFGIWHLTCANCFGREFSSTQRSTRITKPTSMVQTASYSELRETKPSSSTRSLGSSESYIGLEIWTESLHKRANTSFCSRRSSSIANKF